MTELIPVVNIPPQSHSSLEVFKTCPKQYYHKYVARDVKFQPSYASEWGDNAHKHLELYLKASGNYVIPDERHKDTGQSMRDYQWVADALLNRAAQRGGYVLAERQFAVDRNHDTAGYWDKDAWLRGKIDVTIIYNGLGEAEVYDYKGLPLDTPLPTPDGWTNMGAVQVGDTLYSRSGTPTKVVAKSKIKTLPCYRIRFDDNTSVVCDEEHLWVTTDETVVPVTELKAGDRIPLPLPLECEARDLPIHPYVLGLWLADGKHTSGEIAKPDDEVWQEVRLCGYEISHDYSDRAGDGKCRVHTVMGLRTGLRELGLLGNKHIPVQYLRADAESRVALVQGLFDGDGSANTARKQAVLSGCDAALVGQVRELLLSLGVRATMRPVTAHGFGKTVTAYSLTFRPSWFNPFRLPRKAEKAAAMMGVTVDRFGRSFPAKTYRKIVSVVEVPSVPTQCIAVDAPDHTFLCTEHMIPTHNTGKKKSEVEQAKLYSASALVDYSNIHRVKAGYIWLKLPKEQMIDKPIVYTRNDLATMWQPFEQKYAALAEAYTSGVFPPKPNPLCRQWCDCPCQFNGRGAI